MTEDKKSLDIRLSKIENKLSELTSVLGSRVSETKASREDIDTYLRVVRAALAVDWGDMCGINDCYKCIQVCKVCRTCEVCVVACESCGVECTCGPCNICSYEISPRERGIRDFRRLARTR